MVGMSTEQAAQLVIRAVSVKREDIARAKNWIVHAPGTNTSGMVDEWLRQQGIADVREVNIEAENCGEILTAVAKAYSIRLAFYQATWELIASGLLISAGSTGNWDPPLGYRTPRGAGGIPVRQIGFPFPDRLHRISSGAILPLDVDIFLKGIDCNTLHSGILEAIEQSLECFRRGLYMPATVMLAAAAEATWTECAVAIGKRLGTTSLQKVLHDEPGFGKLVSEVHKALQPKTVKPLLEGAGRTIHHVQDAEVWTSALRDRRNALHWGKARSFIADHSETGILLMAAPQHLGTLEAVRLAC